MRKQGYLVLFFLCIYSNLDKRAYSAELEPISIDNHEIEGLEIGKNLVILEDSKRQHTIETIASGQLDHGFIRSQQTIPTMGYGNQAVYWAKFSIANRSNKPMSLYLVNQYAPTDYLTLYELENGTFQERTYGDKVPFIERELDYRYPVYKIAVPTGMSTYYFKLWTSSSAQFAIRIWSPQSFIKHKLHESIFLGGLFGCCIAMLIYNFFICVKFRSKTYFAYSFCIFLYILFSLNYQGLLQQYIFRTGKFIWAMNQGMNILVDLCGIAASTFSILFLSLRTSFPQVCKTFFLIILILSLNIANHLFWDIAAIKVSVFMSLIYSIVMIIVGILRSKTYRPARYYSYAWSIVMFGNMAVILGGAGFIPHSNLTIWGQFVGAALMLLILSLALADRMALVNLERQQSLEAQSQLQLNLLDLELEKIHTQELLLAERENSIKNLDKLVAEKTGDIRSILETINEGILPIAFDGQRFTITSDFSTYASQLLGRDDLSGDDIFKAFIDHTNLTSDEKSTIIAVFRSCLNEEGYIWDLNAHLLPKELELQIDDNKLLLSLDWSPIIDQNANITNRILLTFKDFTEVKKLKDASFKHTREMKTISNILDTDVRRFHEFLEFLHQGLKSIECFIRLDQYQISKNRNLGSKVLRKVYRDLHTLKGITRAYNFKELSSTIHHAEDVVQNTLERSEFQLPSEFHSCFKALKKQFSELRHINYNILKREHHDNVTVAKQKLSFLVRFLNSAPLQDHPRCEKCAYIVRHLTLLYRDNFQTFLEAELKHLDALCHRLGKPKPHLTFLNDSYVIKDDIKSTMKVIFTHIIRNAIDHGIEEPLERIRQRKDPKARIRITAQENCDDTISIIVEDDGRGLDIKAICSKAMEHGIIDSNNTYSTNQIANLILGHSFSTANKVTEVSGRGVGLDAVVQALELVDGTLLIETHDSRTHEGHVPFLIRIDLPFRYFERIENQQTEPSQL
ncbi:7TM diverse intracellular signaling domain-containing protein [Pseudobacteriovorax antillogorgiicola]|uniref:Histidine kinase-, DNA gyrase B-, and HSP90-like ATPase n=1 Tax=Pseudobacteriovorax antillogorgiicola TaxID=1513793 RepID=A0A1Y6BSY8_9BACT|nr:7TM diverse intracellular signaling domain-containing protein [Pseudobacteriovorax antillogorgiicola]TCS53135.1 histidine kinase/DNA gyrase B/HSP90-like ATPase [Pseudobacteriovorax antillogorgiicola]SMF25321.1 Histidine kinase-, DNA gyrase B-, and HSP90-like ATPase [Pseudobacteriovorax antillogorgiicola]